MTNTPEQLSFKTFTPPEQGEAINYNQVTYYIGPKIGQGSFGVVYKCVDSWGNELAAKILLPNDQPYETILSKWEHEFKTLVTLRHPNITHIYAAFEYRDTFYLITERCHSTVADLLNIPGYNGFIWAIPIARCILQAIYFLHAAGMAHKDIHPGNVFTSLIKDELIPDKDRTISFKLGDFGISNIASNIDMFNTILAEWMLPPEFINPHDFGAIDHRLDIYHCGLLLLQVLTGQYLNLTRQQIIEGVPRQMAENLPSPYNFALSKALRRHVAYRTASAMELWRDLKIDPST